MTDDITPKPKQKRVRRAPEHYVANRRFSDELNEYVISVHAAKSQDKTPPMITPYIADCFMRISEGLSRKDNFIGYPFRDDMVSDGIENCVRAVNNYNIEAATRSGKPNGFGYFTGICFNAFLRRIKKEKIQHGIRDKLLIRSSFSGMDDGITSTHVDIYGRPVIINNSSKILRDAMEREAGTVEPNWPKAKSTKTSPPVKGDVIETPSESPKGFLDAFTEKKQPE